MKRLRSKLLPLLAFYLAVGVSQAVMAVPKQATTSTGKTLDSAAENLLTWIYTDLRPVVFLFIIIATVFGTLVSRDKMKGAAAGLSIGLAVAIIPYLVTKAYSWFF